MVVFDTGAELLLADGYHRVAAAQQLGRGTIKAQVRRGTRRDALAFAVSLGVGQRGVTADEVRAAIRRRTTRDSDWVDRRVPRSLPFAAGPAARRLA